jgi:predicted metal-dependent peptidase
VYDSLPEDCANLSTLDMHIENSDESSWDDMEDRIITAYEMTKNHKGKGNMPGGLKRWIDKLRKSKVRWERIFHRYVGQALAKDDYSFVRVNKRFIGQGMYLPDLRSHIIGNVVIAIDTSGSIGRNCLEQFAAEISKVAHLVNEVTAMTCDAAVQEVVKIQKFDNWLTKLHMRGGGGTDFRPVFDKVKELGIQPELLIYLTDAYGTFPEKKPMYPVLWCVTCQDGMNSIPWGQKVLLPNEKGEW